MSFPVFLAYSPVNARWLDRVKVHLKQFQHHLDVFDESRIPAGADTATDIDGGMRRSRASILLISADFFASDFIVNSVLPTILSRAEMDQTRIIPLLVSASSFSQSVLARFKPFNDPLLALDRMSESEAECVLSKLAEFVLSLPAPRDISPSNHGTRTSPRGQTPLEQALEFFGADGLARAHIVAGSRVEASPSQRLIPKFCFDSPTGTAEPEGVDCWLAHQDIRAATYIAQAFAGWGARVEFTLDTVAQCSQPRSFIALGLGFNSMTTWTSKQFSPELFGIYGGESPYDQSSWTPNISLTGRVLARHRHLSVNATSEVMPNPDMNEDYALIVRAVLTPRQDISFVCAGRSADGTAAAGWYLAKHWETLLQLYDKDHDPAIWSMAVLLRYQRHLGTNSDRTTERVPNETHFARARSVLEDASLRRSSQAKSWL